MSASGQFLLAASGHFHVRQWAFFHVRRHRIVLNAFYPLGYHPGGLRTWWRRLHDGSDDELDNTHLMRMAARFARRVKVASLIVV
ncbi:hypothetical protein [Mycobacterium riyadhense]|uniref:hypothetical protein n=1 Tax=Mycobacterium riyadhense TaxID=486698 RepID=UPI0019527430|nr:hypothetical protein [Mycobacterium riyadhense]